MIQNFLKIAIRNLWKNKTFSVINIAGLSLGIAVFTLIMLWVKNEYSYNDFYRDKDRIAAVMINQSFESGEIQTYPATPLPLAKALMDDLPGVSLAATTTWGDQLQFTVDDKDFIEYGLYVSPEYMNVFGYELIKGEKKEILKKPNTIVITESIAEKYFGAENPVGRSIVIGKERTCEVVGVMKNVPKNATNQFNFLLPLQDYLDAYSFTQSNWEANNMRTYLKISPTANFSEMNQKIQTFIHDYTDKQATSSMFLWKMDDWYLRSNFKEGRMEGGQIMYVKIFTIIAFIILLLACVNFMNLSTATATQRLKEIGVRKSIGADRWMLFRQFLMESILLSTIAGIISIGFLKVVIPIFNTHFYKSLDLGLNQPIHLGLYLCIILIAGLSAGFYPAFILSKFDSVKALKKEGLSGFGSASIVRKTLVVVQFAMTILLLTGTMTVSRQMAYLQEKDLGYDKENLIWFANSIPYNKIETAKLEISKIPGVVHTAVSSMTFNGSNNRGHNVSWSGKKEGQDVFFNFIVGDQDLTETMGLEIVEGRSFSKDISTDTSAYILNEEAVRKMNLSNPIGQIIETEGGKGEVVGIMKDFHFESLHNPIGPVILSFHPDWTWLMYVRMDGKNNKEVISAIEDIYQKMAPGYLFEYNFQTEQPQWFYKSEQQTALLSKWFSGIAILLSCLGLLGLTIFTVARKEKEISIRKVMGASARQIVFLIAGQFILLVLLAIAGSLLPAYYVSHSWLENFAYYTPSSWTSYLAGPVLAILLALITIALNVIKVALSNPVKALRSE